MHNKNKDDYHRYKNSFHEHVPNNHNYKFIIQKKKDIFKTINKMKFALKMNKFIVRISNEIGNQMFMYASTFAIAKKLNRSLYIDDETAFLTRKNISKYALNNFNLSS